MLAGLAQTASFTANATSGCSPVVVTFQDQSTGSPTSWFWDFGNGATSTLQNPSTTYFTPGSYTVKLTVTKAGNSNTLTRAQYVTVYGKPTPNITVNDSVACFPHRAQFTDLSIPSTGTTNNSWLWDFGDGTQSTQQNPLHVYMATGNYSVTFKVTNDKGCYSVLTKTSYIRIAGGVQSAFSNTLPTVCRPPFNISFTNTATGPGTLTWLWNFGDGNTSTVQNPSHNYTTPGNYTVTLTTSSSDGCTDTLSKTNLLNIENINTNFTAPDSVCFHTPIAFINSSTPTPASSQWSFGDATTSTALNPVKTYGATGIYTVKLYNTYSYCTDSFIKNIKVLPRPAAAFKANDSTRCQPPLTVAFQDLSVNAVSWQWDFGDGNTSNQQSPSHTYNGFGSFDVTLVVTNASGCTDTIRRPAGVKIIKPEIVIEPLPIRGCLPFTLNPVARITTLDAVTSYSWNFGDGFTSNLPNPSHTYTVQGSYSVTLTITTSSGCTETLVVPGAVTVGRKPVVNFSATPNPVCAFQPVQFTDLTNEADEWLWNFGDGATSTNQNPLHEYSDTGHLAVILYATNSGCRDSLLFEFIQVKPPIARFGYQTNCIDRLLFNFRDSSIGATSWFWDFGDGTTSTAQNPSHTFPSYNTYNVSLTVTNDTCSHTVTKPIRVIKEITDFAATFTSACRRTTFFFNALVGNPANIVQYVWTFGDGSQWNSDDYGLSTSAYHFYPNAGYYTDSLITTDIYGCKDTVAKPNYIRVNGPTAGFTAINPTGCQGLTTTFNDQSQGDGISPIVNWHWDYGDGNSQNYPSNGPFQHTYTALGSFPVKLVVTDGGGCKDSVSVPNQVITSHPVADFIALDTFSCPRSTVRFRNHSTGTNFTSVWDFGDGNTSTMLEPTNNYTLTGNYDVTLTITDQYGCSASMTRPGYIRVKRPIASFTVNDSISSCTPFEVHFTNTSQYNVYSQWDLGGGTSTLDNPIQFYNTPGTYNIRLIARSPGSCEDTAYGTIKVFDTTGAYVRYLPLDGCKPLRVNLNTYSPGPGTYTWDFGDGVLVNTDDTTYTSHIYDFFGNFVPKVILTDPAGCIIPITGLDTIRIKGATVKFGLDKKLLCDSGWIQFVDSTSFNDPLSVYNWDFGDGTISHLPNPTHHYDTPGNYTVLLNVLTENACVDTARLTNVLKIVQSPLVSVGGDSVVCINGFMSHFGVFDRSDTAAVSWSWQFPNGHNATTQTPANQQYNAAGNFTVTTIAVNSSGCKDTAVKNIRVNPLPTVSLPSTLTMQSGFSVTIPAVYTPNVMAWAWLPETNINCSDCPQPIVTPKFNTRYTVSFVDSNGCRNTGEVQIIVICKDANVFLPNTFSPNGDGANDVFYIRGRGLDRVKSLRVFNRWGEVVFEQQNFPVNNPLYGWNGTYKGNKPVPDVYVYQVEVFCENSQIIHFEGNVALIQ